MTTLIARTIALALVAVLATGAPAALAKGDDSDDDNDDRDDNPRLVGDGVAVRAAARAESDDDEDGDVDRHKREVRLESDDDRAVFKLQRRDGPEKDELKFSFSTDDLHAKVDYESKNATMKSSVELKVAFRSLVEFADADGDRAYDAGERVARSIDLQHLRWHPLAFEDTTRDGVRGKLMEARADLPGGGVFGLDFYVFGDFVDIGAADLRPSDVKFDVLIERFPYSGNATQVALLVETKQEVEQKARDGDGKDSHDDSDEESDDGGGDSEAESRGAAIVAPGLGPVQAMFSWATTATVDGVERPVETTVRKLATSEVMEEGKSKSQEKRSVYFAYARGNSILHDPVIGVAGTAGESAPGVGVAALGGALVAAAGFVLRRRRDA